MKKHHKKDIDNPWALAWWMKKRDFKSHYKNDPEGTKSKKEPVKKAEYKDEDKPKKKSKFKEWLELREKRECDCGKDCNCKKCHGKKNNKLKFVLNTGGEITEI